MDQYDLGENQQTRLIPMRLELDFTETRNNRRKADLESRSFFKRKTGLPFYVKIELKAKFEGMDAVEASYDANE